MSSIDSTDFPEVVDVDGLLMPIPGDNPAGDNLKYLGPYDEIREARRSDDTLDQGVWERELKLVDWNDVVYLTTEALANRTKDLQVGAWLCEALVKVYGFIGLRDSLKFMRGLHARFWDNLYPEIDEGDMEARANVLSFMDHQLSLAIKEVPITNGSGGINYSLLQREEGKTTSEGWRKATNDGRRAFYEKLNALLKECWTEFQALDEMMDEKYQGQTAGLPILKKSFDNILTRVERQVRERRPSEPDRGFEPHAVEEVGEGVISKPDAAPTVHFTAYHPVVLAPDVWYTLLVYAHVPGAIGAIQSDSQNRLGSLVKDHGRSRAIATNTIARGAEIVAVPEMPGCRFNPSRASFLWLEDWHRIEFRLQASPKLPGFQHGAAHNGRIAFYVGPLLVGEIKFWAHFKANTDEVASQRYGEITTDFYQAIFVSYSHEDRIIVDQLEKAYTVLGIQYLRDLRILRSGEEWNTALLRKIDEAAIFQLCWSNAAKQSEYVEREWRHALELGRPAFIRPVYWEKPMPQPPSELAEIHFACLEFK